MQGLNKIVDGAYLVAMGNANAVLLDAGPELILVDAGFPARPTASSTPSASSGENPTI